MLASAVIWIVLSLTVLGAVLPRRRRNITELTIGTTALIVVSIFLVPLIGSTLHPVYTADSGSNAGLTQRIFVAAWWLLAARIVVLAGRIAIGIRHREHAVRLASDLAAGAVYLGAILTVLSLSFSVSVAGLVATSGIIAIVVGLALQSTLGDLFSGIALGIEKPFGIGDYIWLEGAIEGLVLETNWRATRIVTDSNDIATVPNSVIAKGRLLNRSRPNETRTDTVRIVLEPSVSPSRGTQLLTAAALSTSGLARDPPTHVICTELRGEGTAYEIRFSAPRRALLEARSLLLHSVARHVRHAGIAMALQNGLPLQGMPASERDRLLSESELLRDLGPEDLAQLAAQLVERRGRANETLFKQGGHKASLFFIAEGAFEVLHEDGANGKRLGVIGPGDDIGDLSLLTGAPNPATVRALTSFVVYELSKEVLSPSMCSNPRLLRDFEAGAARSQARIDLLLTEQGKDSMNGGSHLIDRIKSFFEIRSDSA